MKYEIIRELGKGANGSVNLVKNMDKNGRLEVLKTIRKSKNNGSGVYNELMLQRLNHPNLPKIYYHDETDEAHLIYYEYIENTVELYKFIEAGKSKSLTKEEKNKISKKLIDALKYLHEHKFVHADIKPQNILINQTTYEPYLIDFDLSCEYYAVGDKTRKNRNCNTKRKAGTPNYISPYVLLESYTPPATDIYSMGYTLMCLYLDVTCPPWDTCSYDMSNLFILKQIGDIQIKGDKVFNPDNKIVSKITPLPENIEKLLNYMMSRSGNDKIDYEFMLELIPQPKQISIRDNFTPPRNKSPQKSSSREWSNYSDSDSSTQEIFEFEHSHYKM